ncbi:MAG: metal ABC transporter substrate-binding protein [Solobacterium sp.]|nr:metal ABC transporter substrate-binding protein [Solobacterium sp.]
MKHLIRILTVCLCACLLSGCSAIKRGIVYTVYPIGYLISRLAGNTVSTASLQGEHVMVQRAQIVDNYMELLENSEVFFHIGSLEPYLTVYGEDIRSSGISQTDLSTLNAVYAFKRYTQVITDGEVNFVEGPYYRGEEFDTIDTDPLDLYLWNDPIAMLSMAKNISGWLTRSYPEDSDKFSENLKRLETDLINLDAQYQALSTNLVNNNQEIRFVSMSASFGNWQKTYGFQVYPVMLSKYGVLPDAAQLAAIKARILQDGVRYIVYEPNMTQDMIDLFNQLQEELSLTRVELCNLSSLTEAEEDAGKDYLSLMYENLSVLETMKTAVTSSQD